MTRFQRLSFTLASPKSILAGIAVSILCLIIAIVAMTTAWEAKTVADHTAIREAQQAQTQLVLQRDAFCELYVAIADAPLPPNVSSFGRTISEGAKHTVAVLGCPNPNG